MRPLCAWWCRRLTRHAALGEPIPPRTPLAAHVARCPACRAEWLALRRLTGELHSLPSAPAAPPDFTAAVMARIRTLPAPLRAQALLPALACLSLLTASSIGGWSLRHPAAQREARPISAPVNLPPLVFIPEISPTPEPPPPVVRKPASNPLSRPRRLARLIRHKQAPPARVVISAPEPADWSRFAIVAPPPEHRSATLAILQAEAIRLEREGRFDGAAILYRRAHAEQPEPAVTFAAAQACERAGDLSDAVDFYSELLMRDPAPAPERGAEEK